METPGNVSIGRQNVQTAEDIIRSEGLSIHTRWMSVVEWAAKYFIILIAARSI